MKNVSVILNVVLIVAVAVLYILHFSCGKSKCTSGSNSQTDSVVVNKDIAYVRIDSLVTNLDMYHDMKGEFEKKAKQMEAEFTAKGRSFQKEVADYQEKASKGLITRSQAEQMEQQLQRRQAELEQTGQKMRTELAEQEGVMLRQIQEKIDNYIKKFNEGGKYSLIISTSALNNNVLLALPSMDITSDLMKGLNEEYIQTRGTTTTTVKPEEKAK